MSEQRQSRSFHKLARFLAPVAIAALLLAAGISVMMAHAAPSLSGGSSVCLNVTGTVTGTGAITMTILNLLPGLPLDLSGLHNPSLGAHGGLGGTADLALGLLQLSGSWSATLKVSH